VRNVAHGALGIHVLACAAHAECVGRSRFIGGGPEPAADRRFGRRGGGVDRWKFRGGRHCGAHRLSTGASLALSGGLCDTVLPLSSSARDREYVDLAAIDWF